MDMLLSAVSVLDVAQSSLEIPEGLMNNPVLPSHLHLGIPCHLFWSRFPIKTWYTFLLPHVQHMLHSSQSAHLTILTASGEYKSKRMHHICNYK